MKKSIIKSEIEKFLHGNPEEYNITISSTKKIKEGVSLVHFSYTAGWVNSCVAVVYEDGRVYTPKYWDYPEWNDDNWKISDTEWRDAEYNTCVIVEGLPTTQAS